MAYGLYMDVSKNKGTPKSMIYEALREIPINMDDLGGTIILGDTHMSCMIYLL